RSGRTSEMHERLYRSLYRIRRVEEEIARAYPTDRIKSPVHLSIGQEAVSVGVCAALGPRDVVYGTYRGHALYLARGGDLRAMIAELYGRATGCTKGKGGAMHLIAPERGVMGPAVCERDRAHGMPAERLDGDDLPDLVGRARDVVARLRAGGGPWFFEVMTYRWREHVGPGEDYHLGYRAEVEAAPWKANDAVRRM